MEHRGVSAAEKYAELEKAGALRPRCSCHGEEMKWHKDWRRSLGGRWRCAKSAGEIICSIEGCGNSHHARGWCKAHYLRWRKCGDPLLGGPIKSPKCKWLSWDEEGRPSCEHGPARKHGETWRCGEKSRSQGRRWREANPEKVAAQAARQVRMFGQRFRVPDMQFREHAVQLREERRRALREALNGCT